MLKLVCFVYFVDLVHLVSFVQPNKQDKPNNDLLLLTDFFSIPLYELCARPGKYPDRRFDPSCVLRLCNPNFDCVGDLVTLSRFERGQDYTVPSCIEG
jgi:hypothetical protein